MAAARRFQLRPAGGRTLQKATAAATVIFSMAAFTAAAHAQISTRTPTPDLSPPTQEAAGTVAAATVAAPTAEPIPTLDGNELFQARLQVENPAPLIGEPNAATLIIEAPGDLLIGEPIFPDQAQYSVTDVGEFTPVQQGDPLIYEQELTLFLWELGDPVTLKMNIQLPSSARPDTVYGVDVAPVSFNVRETIDPNFNPNPLKPAVTLPYVSPLLLVAGVAVAVTAAGGVWAWRSRTRTTEFPADLAPDTPAGRALHTLNVLGEREIPPVKLYPAIADILRVYVQQRLGVSAIEKTTYELMRELAGHPHLSPTHQKELEKILQRCDLVKFARVQPRTQSAERLLAVCRNWVTETNEAVEALLEREKEAERAALREKVAQ